MTALLTLATALTAAAARSAAPCLGEFELDPSSGECKLSSNFNVATDAFDADEVHLASRKRLAAASFPTSMIVCLRTSSTLQRCIGQS